MGNLTPKIAFLSIYVIVLIIMLVRWLSSDYGTLADGGFWIWLIFGAAVFAIWLLIDVIQNKKRIKKQQKDIGAW